MEPWRDTSTPVAFMTCSCSAWGWSDPVITIIGSANMDLITQVKRFPAPGETVLAGGLYQACGGKGANQAVACARAGCEVNFVGCVGDDANGRELAGNLRSTG